MHPGKLWTPVLKRSVLNIFNCTGSTSAAKLQVGEDAADFIAEDASIKAAEAVREGRDPSAAKYAVHNAANNLYAGGCLPSAVLTALHLGKGEEEGVLKQWIRQIDEACRELGIRPAGGHTSVSAWNACSFLAATAIGRKRHPALQIDPKKKDAYEGFQILMVKHAALEGTSLLIGQNYESLHQNYTSSFLDGIQEGPDDLSIRREAGILWDYIMKQKRGKVLPVLHDISEGGIFGALWELAEYLSCGFRIDQKSILLRQITIEICEAVRVNPYMLKTCGSLLAVVEDPAVLLREFADAGIPAAVIGEVTPGNARILMNQEDIRYIGPFRGDSVYAADQFITER